MPKSSTSHFELPNSCCSPWHRLPPRGGTPVRWQWSNGTTWILLQPWWVEGDFRWQKDKTGSRETQIQTFVEMGDMWADEEDLLWLLALHDHYTSWLQCATCHLGWVQVIWLSHNRPVCARNPLQNKMAGGNWRVLSGHVLRWSLLTYKLLHQGHPEDGSLCSLPTFGGWVTEKKNEPHREVLHHLLVYHHQASRGLPCCKLKPQSKPDLLL